MDSEDEGFANFVSNYGAILDDHVIYARQEISQAEIKSNFEYPGRVVPFHKAMLEGNFELVKKFLCNGHSLNEVYDITPLHLAIEFDNEEIFELLLSMGADVNKMTCTCDYCSTPLCQAVSLGKLHFVKRLLMSGAWVNAPKEGIIVKRKFPFMKDQDLVFVCDAASNGFDYDCGSSLHAACFTNHFGNKIIDIIYLLLQNGAKINAKVNNMTPLHAAVLVNQPIRLVKLLMSYGANIWILNGDGKRASQLCEVGSEIHEFLVAEEIKIRPLTVLCRNSIRNYLGPHRLHHIRVFATPRSIKRFLLEEEFS